MEPQDGWKVGDLVQIVDEAHGWFPCVLFVSEVKSWGVIAFAMIPKANDGSVKPAEAYTRLEHNAIQRVGSSLYMPQGTAESM